MIINPFVSNNKGKLKKVVLGSVPTPSMFQKKLKRPMPKVIHKILEETLEDLDEIKKMYTKLGVQVLSYPVNTLEDSINVRNGFIIIDDHMYITERSAYLEPLYNSVAMKTFVPHTGNYSPDIYINDDYAILDRLYPEAYRYWRNLLSPRRKIITAFNKGHSDGIYCNVADKIWLTNGNSLNFKKYWPDIPVMELSITNSGTVNDWTDPEDFFRRQELYKTRGRYLVSGHRLSQQEISFVDRYLNFWVGYCEETLFDLNLSIVDAKNIMVISKNSLVYDTLETLDIKIHKVPFRHRFFWDGGLHCITNDLVRER